MTIQERVDCIIDKLADDVRDAVANIEASLETGTAMTLDDVDDVVIGLLCNWECPRRED